MKLNKEQIKAEITINGQYVNGINGVFVGLQAGMEQVTGINGVFVGLQAGGDNIGIGLNAGKLLTEGSGSIRIGGGQVNTSENL